MTNRPLTPLLSVCLQSRMQATGLVCSWGRRAYGTRTRQRRLCAPAATYNRSAPASGRGSPDHMNAGTARRDKGEAASAIAAHGVRTCGQPARLAVAVSQGGQTKPRHGFLAGSLPRGPASGRRTPKQCCGLWRFSEVCGGSGERYNRNLQIRQDYEFTCRTRTGECQPAIYSQAAHRAQQVRLPVLLRIGPRPQQRPRPATATRTHTSKCHPYYLAGRHRRAIAAPALQLRYLRCYSVRCCLPCHASCIASGQSYQL